MRKQLLAGASAATICFTLVCGMEGRSLIAFLDPVGIPTICDGDTAGVKMGDRDTPAGCDARTRKRIGEALALVDSNVRLKQPETRRAALGSFVYNVGGSKFLRSTLLKKLNAGDVRGACDELLRWTYAGGRQLGGLVRRRKAERDLCLAEGPI